MSEFAWSMMEPEEGNYQFNWLVDALKLKADDVVLGAPSATPPVNFQEASGNLCCEIRWSKKDGAKEMSNTIVEYTTSTLKVVGAL